MTRNQLGSSRAGSNPAECGPLGLLVSLLLLLLLRIRLLLLLSLKPTLLLRRLIVG